MRVGVAAKETEGFTPVLVLAAGLRAWVVLEAVEIVGASWWSLAGALVMRLERRRIVGSGIGRAENWMWGAISADFC